MAARIVKIPHPNSTLRSHLHSDHSTIIDGLLKELQLLSRKLANNAVFWKEETLLLQRLYYKSLNQHKRSVFWRRIVEMRRFVQRINDVNISSLVDFLRYSFFDKDGQANSKLLKNAWSYVPSLHFVTFLSRRIKAAHTLVEKARERYALAHESLVLLMRTGAFLQLVLVLVAIVSRLQLLLGELQEILQSLQLLSTRIISFIHASERTNIEEVEITNAHFQDQVYEQYQLAVKNTTLKFCDEHESHLDSNETTSNYIGNTFVLSTVPNSTSNVMDGIIDTSSTGSLIQSEQKITISPSDSSLIASTSSLAVDRTKKVKSTNDSRKGQSKKKTSNVRRDEIDDIFAGI